MASSQKMSFDKCEKYPGHQPFVTLQNMAISCLPDSHRSHRNLALIRMLSVLVVRVESPGDIRSGIIISLEERHNDIIFRIRTAAHEGYDKDEMVSTTVILHMSSTGRCLKSGNVQLEELKRTDTENNFVDDIRYLRAIFPRKAFTYCQTDDILTDINNALMPNIDTLCAFVLKNYQTDDILTDINNALMPNIDTLCAFCFKNYQTMQYSLPSFLKENITCIENIKFAVDKIDVLEIELDISETYVIDVSLFILAFASHPDAMRSLLEICARGEDLNTCTEYSGVTVVSTQIFAEQSAIFGEISLCKLLSEQNMDKINDSLRSLFLFEISVRRTKSNLMSMFVGSTSMSGVTQEQDAESTDIAIDDVNKNQNTLVALVSCVHGVSPPCISFGLVEKCNGYGEVMSTTPSCPGSSGGLLILIPGQRGTKLKDITFAAHKSGTDVKQAYSKVLGAGTKLRQHGLACGSTDMQDDSVGQVFRF